MNNRNPSNSEFSHSNMSDFLRNQRELIRTIQESQRNMFQTVEHMHEFMSEQLLDYIHSTRDDSSTNPTNPTNHTNRIRPSRHYRYNPFRPFHPPRTVRPTQPSQTTQSSQPYEDISYNNMPPTSFSQEEHEDELANTSAHIFTWNSNNPSNMSVRSTPLRQSMPPRSSQSRLPQPPLRRRPRPRQIQGGFTIPLGTIPLGTYPIRGGIHEGNHEGNQTNNAFSSITSILNNLTRDLDSTVPVPVSTETVQETCRTFTYEDASGNRTTECPIDLSPFQEGDEVLEIIHCGHCFRKSNLLRWFETNPKCPICRVDVRDTVISNTGNTGNTDLSGNNTTHPPTFNTTTSSASNTNTNSDNQTHSTDNQINEMLGNLTRNVARSMYSGINDDEVFRVAFESIMNDLSGNPLSITY